MRPILLALLTLAAIAALPSHAEGLAVGPWDARAGVYHRLYFSQLDTLAKIG